MSPEYFQTSWQIRSCPAQHPASASSAGGTQPFSSTHTMEWGLCKKVLAEGMVEFQVSPYSNFWFEIRESWKHNNKTQQDRWLFSGRPPLRSGIPCPYLIECKPYLQVSCVSTSLQAFQLFKCRPGLATVMPQRTAQLAHRDSKAACVLVDRDPVTISTSGGE